MRIALPISPLVVLTLLAFSLPSHRAAAGPRAVAIVLDCSSSMSAPMSSAPGASATDANRLDVAKDALQAALTKFSEHPDCQAALWLFGHRLAWEDGDTPALREQTAYLEQTLGFKVLEELMPGDDVELVRPLSAFEPEHVDMLSVRLENVKPWGEDPLYLTLVRCLDNLPHTGLPADVSIVVITDGGNRQGLAKHLTRRSAVLEAYDRHEVPLQFILIGDGQNDRKVEAEFKQLANRTGGGFERAADGEALTRALEAALKVDAPPDVESVDADAGDELADEEPAEEDEDESLNDDHDSPAALALAEDAVPPLKPSPKPRFAGSEPTLLEESADEPADESEAASEPEPEDVSTDEDEEEPAKSPMPPRRRAARSLRTKPASQPQGIRLQGLVTFYGKPVKKATIKLVDSDVEPVVTGPDGRFEFRDLPEGSYTLSCEAIVRNVVRETTAPIRLSAKTRGSKAVDVKLE